MANELQKMYTFQFSFVNPNTGRDDSVQFCAVDFVEARALFGGWIDEERLEPAIINEAKCEAVRNEEDAKEYGDRYGDPSDLLITGISMKFA